MEKRLANILDTLTTNIYNYGCTGIFERHKLLFSFQISIKLEMEKSNVTQRELDFFTKVGRKNCNKGAAGLFSTKAQSTDEYFFCNIKKSLSAST